MGSIGAVSAGVSFLAASVGLLGLGTGICFPSGVGCSGCSLRVCWGCGAPSSAAAGDNGWPIAMGWSSLFLSAARRRVSMASVMVIPLLGCVDKERRRVIKWKYQKSSRTQQRSLMAHGRGRQQNSQKSKAKENKTAMSYLINFRENRGVCGRNSPSLRALFFRSLGHLSRSPDQPSDQQALTYCHFPCTFDDSRQSTGRNKGISFIIF